MKYYIEDTNIEFKIGDLVEVPRYWKDIDTSDIGVITRITETMWKIRDQLNVYINGENTYYKHSDIRALYRKDEKGNFILLWKSPYAKDNYFDEEGAIEIC